MSCTSGSSTVFTWFQNLTTIANLFTWMSVSIAYIRFHAALKAQGVDRSRFGSALSRPTRPSQHSNSSRNPLSQQNSRDKPRVEGHSISYPSHHPNMPVSAYSRHKPYKTYGKHEAHVDAGGTLHHPNALNCNPYIHPSNSISHNDTEPGYHMPFRSPWQPYLAYFSLVFFAIVTVFNGKHHCQLSAMTSFLP